MKETREFVTFKLKKLFTILTAAALFDIRKYRDTVKYLIGEMSRDFFLSFKIECILDKTILQII